MFSPLAVQRTWGSHRQQHHHILEWLATCVCVSIIAADRWLRIRERVSVQVSVVVCFSLEILRVRRGARACDRTHAHIDTHTHLCSH